MVGLSAREVTIELRSVKRHLWRAAPDVRKDKLRARDAERGVRGLERRVRHVEADLRPVRIDVLNVTLPARKVKIHVREVKIHVLKGGTPLRKGGDGPFWRTVAGFAPMAQGLGGGAGGGVLLRWK